MKRPARRLLPWGAVLLPILPNLAWILLDRGVWTGDTPSYGRLAHDLLDRLLRDPGAWFGSLPPHQAPLLVVLGQPFAWLGRSLGALDRGLLLLGFASQVASLSLLFCAFRALFASTAIAAIGALVLASSPLFVALSTGFWAEPLQLLAVVWFVTVMARAGEWSASTTLLQLAAASAFAMLAKISSPLYCAGPGLLALAGAMRARGSRPPAQPAAQIALALLAALLVLFAAAFYASNLESMLAFLRFAVASPEHGPDWGARERLAYWLFQLRVNLLGAPAFWTLAVLLGAALLAGRRRSAPGAGWALPAVAASHLVLALAVFTSARNIDPRYLLPLLPHVALLVGWSLSRLDRRAAELAAAALLLFQLAGVQAHAFGLRAPDARPFPFHDAARPLERRAEPRQRLTQLARGLCPTGRERIVTAMSPVIDDFQLEFHALVRFGRTCEYEGVEHRAAQMPPYATDEDAWRELLALDFDAFAALDPRVHGHHFAEGAPPSRRRAGRIAERVAASELFEPRVLVGYEDLMLYRRLRR